MADAEQKNDQEVDLIKKLDKTFEFDKVEPPQLEELAKLAETSERYEDMVVFMKKLVDKQLKSLEGKSDEDLATAAHVLSTENRNLFSVAYKNVVGSRRSSWRALTENLGDEGDGKGTPALKGLKIKYLAKVANEIQVSCLEIQGILKKLAAATEKIDDAVKASGTVKPVKDQSDDHIFYLKMCGDYYRYLREAFKDNEDYKTKCKENYAAAMKKAEDQLEPTNPTRLGLALNYSVCHYEILGNEEEACKLAKTAFDEAIEKLDSLNDSSYKDSTLIMQLLRDNLTIWSQKDEPETQQ